MSNKIKEYIQHSEFIKNVLTLMTGTILAQLIPLLISPFLTRIYSPDDFGLLSLYLSVTGMIAIIATGRYELATMLPEKDDDAINIVCISFLITIVLTLFIFILVTLFNNPITLILNNPRISNWLFFVPLSVFFAGVIQNLTFWLNRNRKYKEISVMRTIQALTINGAQLATGSKFSTGLIIGNIFGQGITFLLLVIRFFYNTPKELFKKINKKNMGILMKTYRDFPMINSFHAFTDIAKDSITIILISNYFNATTLGYYALTIRILKTPIIFIGSAIGQVFFKDSTKYLQEGILFQKVKSLIFKNIIIALPIFIGLFILSETIFSLVFGKEWGISGVYTRIMTPLFFINYISSPLSVIPLVLNKQKGYFLLNLIRSIFFVGTFTICGELNINIYDTLLWVMIITTIWGVMNITYVLNISKQKSIT